MQARCKRWSVVTSQRGLPREPVHIHVQIHGWCCYCMEDVKALLVACAAWIAWMCCAVSSQSFPSEARFGQRQ
jgi:hypothetical protein